jgi:hypothetical protein
MRRIVSIAVVLLVVLVAASLVYEFICVAICDGSYDLSVTVKSLSSSPIRAVGCQGFRNVDEARSCLEYLPPPETRLWLASAEPFTGQPLVVPLPFSFRASPLGRTWGDTQYRGLVVIVQYQDGERKGKAIEIPHRNESRSVTVEVP